MFIRLLYNVVFIILQISFINCKNEIEFPLFMTEVVLELRVGPIVIRKDIAKVAKFINISSVPCEKKGRFEMQLKSLNDPIFSFACSKLPISSIKSSIVMIERGQCSLHSKAMRVYDANVLGMIIINDKDDMFHADFDPSEKNQNQIKEEKLCYDEYKSDENILKYCLDEIKLKYLLQLLVVMIPKSIGLAYKQLLNDYSIVMVRVYDKECNERNIDNYLSTINTLKTNKMTQINTIMNDTTTDTILKADNTETEMNYFNEICPILQKPIDKRSLKRIIDRAIEEYPNRFTDIDDIDTAIYNDKDKIINLLCFKTNEIIQEIEYEKEL